MTSTTEQFYIWYLCLCFCLCFLFCVSDLWKQILRLLSPYRPPSQSTRRQPKCPHWHCLLSVSAAYRMSWAYSQTEWQWTAQKRLPSKRLFKLFMPFNVYQLNFCALLAPWLLIFTHPNLVNMSHIGEKTSEGFQNCIRGDHKIPSTDLNIWYLRKGSLIHKLSSHLKEAGLSFENASHNSIPP